MRYNVRSTSTGSQSHSHSSSGGSPRRGMTDPYLAQQPTRTEQQQQKQQQQQQQQLRRLPSPQLNHEPTSEYYAMNHSSSDQSSDDVINGGNNYYGSRMMTTTDDNPRNKYINNAGHGHSNNSKYSSSYRSLRLVGSDAILNERSSSVAGSDDVEVDHDPDGIPPVLTEDTTDPILSTRSRSRTGGTSYASTDPPLQHSVRRSKSRSHHQHRHPSHNNNAQQLSTLQQPRVNDAVQQTRKQNQRHEARGRIIRNLLLDGNENQASQQQPEATVTTTVTATAPSSPLRYHNYIPPTTPSDPDVEAAMASKSLARRNHNKGRDALLLSHNDEEEEEEIYLVRQGQGYCAILFSVLQAIILGLMMWQCGIAPLNINPMVGPYPDALSEWGGKNSVLIIEDGEWYRLVTPIMLHAGLIHLAGNLFVQLETGVFFEKEWGSIRWLLIYLSSAVGSSILSVIFMPQAVSVGSSGAVMGLFGAKLSEVILRVCERNMTPQEKIGHEVRREQCCAVTCSVIIVMLFSFIPYVDWAAHLGGLISGICVGTMIFAFEVPGMLCKLLWCLVGVALTVVGYVQAIQYMYSGNVESIEELRDVCGYYMEAFNDYQCNCMRDEYFQNGGQ